MYLSLLVNVSILNRAFNKVSILFFFLGGGGGGSKKRLTSYIFIEGEFFWDIRVCSKSGEMSSSGYI